MCKIMINTEINAPGCPCEIVPVCDCGNKISGLKSILIQGDYSYPGVASSFGWSVKNVDRPIEYDDDGDEIDADLLEVCEHDGTDGSVACPNCGCPASDFIDSAYDFLTENDGLIAEDPGYFN